MMYQPVWSLTTQSYQCWEQSQEMFLHWRKNTCRNFYSHWHFYPLPRPCHNLQGFLPIKECQEILENWVSDLKSSDYDPGISETKRKGHLSVPSSFKRIWDFIGCFQYDLARIPFCTGEEYVHFGVRSSVTLVSSIYSQQVQNHYNVKCFQVIRACYISPNSEVFLFQKSSRKDQIDLFSLYILFSHFRPRDATRGNSFFQMSSYARANLRITNKKQKENSHEGITWSEMEKQNVQAEKVYCARNVGEK